MSRNNPDTSLRIYKSIDYYNLDIVRAALSGGESLAPYMHAFRVDLFLSSSEEDVQAAVMAEVAAAKVLNTGIKYKSDLSQIKIAFDADAVVFSEESEKIYKEKGIDAFLRHEKENAKKPLPEGPFAKLLNLYHIFNHSSRIQILKTCQ